MTNASVKFRPSLSAQQISHIVSILSRPEFEGNHLNYACLKALKVFELKAKHGIITPSHITTPKVSIEESLGFSEDTITKKQNEEILLQTYLTNPSILSYVQMQAVQKHRYVNDLMTPEEEAEYESHQ